jgi:polyhydroxybutyrate depolymerase
MRPSHDAKTNPIRIFEAQTLVSMRKIFACCLLCLATLACHAQIITGSFSFDGYIRVYDLHLPTGWTPGSDYPLVLDFHYLGADGRDEDSLTRFNPIANAEQFIICHPYGLGTDWEVGQSVPYHNGLSEVDLVSALIDTLDGRYGVDLNRVYAVGLGQGGFMVHRLACELGHRIAAFAAVGASIADSAAYYCQGDRPIPMMIVHGTADSVIEYNVGLAGYWRSIPDLLAFWQGRDTCAAVPDSADLPDLVQEGSTIRTYRWACAQGSELLLYKVIGGGFAWPGANRDLGSGGVRNMDINASQHIWNFFEHHGLSGPLVVGTTPAVVQPLPQLYPQPAHDVLHVSMAVSRIKEMKIIDLNGREVMAPIAQDSPSQATIDVSALPSGIYILQVGGVARRIAVAR